MNRFIDFAIRRPILVFVILGLITALLAPGMTKLQIDNSIETLMPKHDSKYLFYNKVKETYGDNGQLVVMAVSDGDLWSHETLRKFDALIVDIEEYQDFDEGKEAHRLRRFDRVLSEGTVATVDLMALFDNDPPFRRLLSRLIEKHIDNPDTLDRSNLERLRKGIIYSAGLKRLELIDEIISPLTSEDIKGEFDTLEAYDLVPVDDSDARILPRSKEEIDRFRARLQRNPAYENALYARDPATGEITDFGVIIKFINVEDRDPVARELKEIIENHRDLHIDATGMPIVYVWVVDYIRSDFIILVPLVMFVVMFIFYLNFRSRRGVILPFLSLGLTELWVLGLIGHLGYKITVMASSLPTLMIAVGSSYSIHILNQYYADFDRITERGKLPGLHASMTHISLTVLLAGVTTFIAFMTLSTNELSAVREWGAFSAIGALFAVFISSSLIPAALTLLPHRIPPGLQTTDNTLRTTLVDRIIELMARGALIRESILRSLNQMRIDHALRGNRRIGSIH